MTVVGLGPGDPAWLTPESAAAIAAATDLVGYRPYLARVPQRPGQHRHASGNTVEADRAALALDLAAKGGRVAVVSSGDPGVFAMASAVLEQAASDPASGGATSTSRSCPASPRPRRWRAGPGHRSATTTA